jgi:hypothetical protein
VGESLPRTEVSLSVPEISYITYFYFEIYNSRKQIMNISKVITRVILKDIK